MIEALVLVSLLRNIHAGFDVQFDGVPWFERGTLKFEHHHHQDTYFGQTILRAFDQVFDCVSREKSITFTVNVSMNSWIV